MNKALSHAFLSYRPVTARDAAMLISWRRDPRISAYMISDIDEDMDRQHQWIARINRQTDQTHRIMMVNGTDIGYCSIKTVNPVEAIGEIGVYVGDHSASKLMTIFNFLHILNHAFFAMSLKKIVNHVIANNSRSLKLQKFNGYRPVAILEKHIIKNGQAHDLHVFEQTAAEWRKFRVPFQDWRDLDGQLWPPE